MNPRARGLITRLVAGTALDSVDRQVLALRKPTLVATLIEMPIPEGH